MRLARVRIGEEEAVGEYDGDTVCVEDGTYRIGDEVELLPPCDPSVLYCVGRNYAATIDQQGYERPDDPDFFVKPSVSVLAPNAPVAYPSFTGELVGAGELAAIVDETCTHVTPDEVPEAIRGYTIMNDLDAYDQPGRTARKAFDGSAPLGPCLATDVDPTDLALETRVNGDLDHDGNTADMLFDPFEVVSFLSRRLTLRPGDVVAFGSPTNVGPLEPGDEVSAWYEGVGTLTTTIAPSER